MHGVFYMFNNNFNTNNFDKKINIISSSIHAFKKKKHFKESLFDTKNTSMKLECTCLVAIARNFKPI